MEISEKINQLKLKLVHYQEKLAREMIGYGGVKHESAASEIKHDKVMVLQAIIEEIKEEIANLEKKKKLKKF